MFESVSLRESLNFSFTVFIADFEVILSNDLYIEQVVSYSIFLIGKLRSNCF